MKVNILVLPDLEDLDNIGVHQCRRGPRFAFEAIDVTAVLGQIGVEHLKCNRAVQ